MAFFLAAMMFSLAGVPPLAGFFAKFYVFAAAIKAGLYGLAVIGVLASAVGAYYYLRIVKLMYFDEPAKAFDRPAVRRPQRAGTRGAADHRVRVRALAADRRGDGGRAYAVLSAAPEAETAFAGWRVARFGAIDSTNEEARRRAFAGDPGRLWIVAEEQTAGRGRRGRSWASPRGNLYASALLIDPCPQVAAPQLGFVAGVALARAAEDLGAAGMRLKWPNDLVRDGAKCAGVLVEGATVSGNRLACVVGIGVNCLSAPQGVGYPTAVLRTESGGRRRRARAFRAVGRALRRSAFDVARGWSVRGGALRVACLRDAARRAHPDRERLSAAGGDVRRA